MRDRLQNVSRETLDRLRVFENLVSRWTPRINLVSRADRDHVWRRHIIDSVQLYDVAPQGFAHWLDLGSGGGFPAIVVAILACERNNAPRVTMIESDARKATFLRAALRETGVRGEVITRRIEDVAPMGADVISARALADLTTLLGFAAPHLSRDGTCVFPKGAKWRQELADAKTKWNFSHRVATSDLDPAAAILNIKELSHA